MKTIFFSTLKSKFKMMSEAQLRTGNSSPVFFLLILLGSFFVTSCKQERTVEPNTHAGVQRNENSYDKELLTYYTGLDGQTLLELQQARAATAKYRDIDNATRDNYEDIGLVLPNMGYHFRKLSLIDSVFDITKPELLVYNKNADGKFELVSVEYAVPINPLSPNVPPSGFTGTDDEWDFNTLNTGLWTLHAWVWKNNPDGVFNMTNSLVQVQ